MNSNPVAHHQQQQQKDESNWAVNQKQRPLNGVAMLRAEADMIYSWLCLFPVLSSRTWWNVWQLYSPQEGVNDWEWLGVVLKWPVESISWFLSLEVWQHSFFPPLRLRKWSHCIVCCCSSTLKNSSGRQLKRSYLCILGGVHYLGAASGRDITSKWLKWYAAFYFWLGCVWKRWFVPATLISLFKAIT